MSDRPPARDHTASGGGLTPTAAAIANAVRDAVGLRVHDSPITPPKLAALLAAAGKKG